MSQIIFMADTQDPASPTTYYGKDHQASITNEAQVAAWIAQGKAALMGTAIRNVRVSAKTTTTATIAFTVDQACTGMVVNYGTTTAYGSNQNASPASGVGDITASLTGLTTATLYHYRVQVTCGGYTTLTGDLTFTTN